MGDVESLAAWGVRRPLEVAELAAAVGLELAAAAALLEKESAGGRNVWGHDGVETGGAYVKGGEVTRAAYEAYRALRRAGQIGAQGVGPCQLTHSGYQDQADQLGGCWDWRTNITVGFRALAGLQRQSGARDGFRRYNGSGPAAEAYADDAMARLARWRDRLGGAPPFAQEDDLSPEQDRMLRVVYDELTKRLPNRRGPQGATVPDGGADTALGYAANADGLGFRASWALAGMQGQLDELVALIRAGAAQVADPQAFAAEVAAELTRRLAG